MMPVHLFRRPGCLKLPRDSGLVHANLRRNNRRCVLRPALCTLPAQRSRFIQSRRVLASLLPPSLCLGTHGTPVPRPAPSGERRADPNAVCDLGPKPTPGRGEGLGDDDDDDDDGAAFGRAKAFGLGQALAECGGGPGRELPARPRDGRCRLVAGSAEGNVCPRGHRPLPNRCPGWERVEVPGCVLGAAGRCPFLPAWLEGDDGLGGGGTTPVGGWHWGGFGSLLHLSELETPCRCVQPGFAALLMLLGHISLKIQIS